MNDFTKEELKDLQLSMCWIMLPETKKRFASLQAKVQSLIDNYRDPNCIHEVDAAIKACKLCGLPSHSIPCIGGWL